MSIERINREEIFCSVVMPVHNGEKFLREAIESVLNQTYTNFEFLIIENCSTDSSVEIVKSYNDSRIRLIIENDCGQVQAYNRGFRETKGEYIFIHDQDDLSHNERFEKQLKYVTENDIDICGSCFNLINEKDINIGQICVPQSHDKIIDQLLYKNSSIFNSSVCIKKTVFEQHGYFDVKYFPSADYEFYLRGTKNFIYGNVYEFLYSWRIHSQQISSNFNKDIEAKTILISLKNNEKFPLQKVNTYKGLIYYYNNKLLEALKYFMIAIFKDSYTKILLRCLLIILIGGIPLKLFRKYDLVNSKFFLTSKQFIDKIL